MALRYRHRHRQPLADEDAPPTTSVNDIVNQVYSDSGASRQSMRVGCFDVVLDDLLMRRRVLTSTPRQAGLRCCDRLIPQHPGQVTQLRLGAMHSQSQWWSLATLRTSIVLRSSSSNPLERVPSRSSIPISPTASASGISAHRKQSELCARTGTY